MPGENRLTLDVTLTERGDIRYTPAGITAIDCTLRHESMQAEAGSERRVDCELCAVAFGNVAERLAQVPIGSAFHCEGFLARRYRTGVTVALHVTNLWIQQKYRD